MATIDAEVLNIQHDTNEQRFFYPQKGEEIRDSELKYELNTDGKTPVMNFTHTYDLKPFKG